MAQVIHTNFSASVANNESLQVKEQIQAETSQFVDVVVPEGASDQEIDLFPVDNTGVVLLMITASAYHASALSYKVGADTTVRNLDAAHIFRGKGQAAFLPSDVSRLLVSNTTGADVTIKILGIWNTVT